jgi:hypothetical protein
MYQFRITSSHFQSMEAAVGTRSNVDLEVFLSRQSSFLYSLEICVSEYVRTSLQIKASIKRKVVQSMQSARKYSTCTPKILGGLCSSLNSKDSSQLQLEVVETCTHLQQETGVIGRACSGTIRPEIYRFFTSCTPARFSDGKKI